MSKAASKTGWTTGREKSRWIEEELPSVGRISTWEGIPALTSDSQSRKIQDYVVAHELAYFKHDEHSDAFWNIVDAGSGLSEKREWLRVKSGTLTV